MKVPEEAIISIAQEKNVYLIVCGMKGSGKALKQVFGSTASALVQNSPAPMILVPEKASFVKPGVIVFATDKINSENEIPENLISFVRLFDSKLYVVQVIKNEKERFAEISSEAPEKTIDSSFEYVVANDVSRSLNKSLIKHNADMC